MDNGGKLKESIEYYIDAISPKDFVIFNDGTVKTIKRIKRDTHIIQFDDGKEYDLYVIYDSILTIITTYDDKGNYTEGGIEFLVYNTIRTINENCNYHGYIEVITALLNGEKTYINDYVSFIGIFGRLPNISESEVERYLTHLEKIGFVRQKNGKHGRTYYYTRNDNKLWKRDLVWYVCYGSNLCKKRFMCYITGSSNKEFGIKAGDRCFNQSPIVDIKHIKIPYEMYFGNKSSSWDNGGVSFIKETQDLKKYSFATAYLIEREQYEHIWKREGKSPRWYGHEIELDLIDGFPAKTFTSDCVHEYNEPCQRYLKVVKKGLIEYGLSGRIARQYLFRKLKSDIK